MLHIGACWLSDKRHVSDKSHYVTLPHLAISFSISQIHHDAIAYECDYETEYLKGLIKWNKTCLHAPTEAEIWSQIWLANGEKRSSFSTLAMLKRS
jgi:hypothetical protein